MQNYYACTEPGTARSHASDTLASSLTDHHTAKPSSTTPRASLIRFAPCAPKYGQQLAVCLRGSVSPRITLRNNATTCARSVRLLPSPHATTTPSTAPHHAAGSPAPTGPTPQYRLTMWATVPCLHRATPPPGSRTHPADLQAHARCHQWHHGAHRCRLHPHQKKRYHHGAYGRTHTHIARRQQRHTLAAISATDLTPACSAVPHAACACLLIALALN